MPNPLSVDEMEPHQERQLSEAIQRLAQALTESTREQKHQFEWMVAHSNFVTKSDLKQLETLIMSKLEDLISASTALSTASDALSVKFDSVEAKVTDLITKVDTVVAALQNADLPPAAETALTALKASAATAATATTAAATAGDQIDQEVAKLDKVLPTPAPASPPV